MAILPVLVCAGAWAGDNREPGYTSSYYWVEPGGGAPKHLIVAVRPANGNLAEDFVQPLVRMAYDWDIEQFKRFYPHIDRKFFDEMRAHDSPLDGRSIFVMAFEEGDINKLRGTFRFTLPSPEKPRLPLEDELGHRVPRPKLEVGDYTSILLGTKETSRELQGSVVELKNFVLHPDAKLDLFPSLLHVGEWETDWVVGFRSKMALFRLDEGRAEISRIPGHMAYPTEYVIMCDQKLVPYYRRLGFELAQEKPVKGTVHVMRMNRAGFLEFAAKTRKRSGGAVLDAHNVIPVVRSPQVEALRAGVRSQVLGLKRPILCLQESLFQLLVIKGFSRSR